MKDQKTFRLTISSAGQECYLFYSREKVNGKFEVIASKMPFLDVSDTYRPCNCFGYDNTTFEAAKNALAAIGISLPPTHCWAA
jgi:hypothetical protein